MKAALMVILSATLVSTAAPRAIDHGTIGGWDIQEIVGWDGSRNSMTIRTITQAGHPNGPAILHFTCSKNNNYIHIGLNTPSTWGFPLRTLQIQFRVDNRAPIQSSWRSLGPIQQSSGRQLLDYLRGGKHLFVTVFDIQNNPHEAEFNVTGSVEAIYQFDAFCHPKVGLNTPSFRSTATSLRLMLRSARPTSDVSGFDHLDMARASRTMQVAKVSPHPSRRAQVRSPQDEARWFSFSVSILETPS